MAINVERFGETLKGQQADKYTLTNEHGVSASFTNLGGTWISMLVPDKNGKMADVVLGYDNLESYLKNPAHSVLLSEEMQTVSAGQDLP